MTADTSISRASPLPGNNPSCDNIKRHPRAVVPPFRASFSETPLQRDGEAICFSGTTLKGCQSLNPRDRLARRHRHHLSSVLAQSNTSTEIRTFIRQMTASTVNKMVKTRNKTKQKQTNRRFTRFTELSKVTVTITYLHQKRRTVITQLRATKTPLLYQT